MTTHLSTHKGNVTVSAARPEHAYMLFELRLEALTAHPESFAADVEIARARGAEAWADQIQRESGDESGVIMTAWAGEVLIGMAGVGRGHWPKTRHSAIVWGVYVRPDWRGLRIADALLDECAGWAREHAIVVLKLGVTTTNSAAMRCYERCGFKIYGTEPMSNLLDGVYSDEYLMARMV